MLCYPLTLNHIETDYFHAHMAKLPEDELQKRLGDLYGKIPIYPEAHIARKQYNKLSPQKKLALRKRAEKALKEARSKN